MMALQLMLLEDFGPFMRLVESGFPDIVWHRASSVAAATEVLAEADVDGAIVDLHLSMTSPGWRIVAAAELADSPVLILTSDQNPRHVSEAQRLGVAIDYKPNWKTAIDAFSRRVFESANFRLRTFADEHRLTRREREVLGLYVEDYDRDEIAERLGISEWTVRVHLRAVLGKCPLPRLAEVRRRIRRGA